jgi:hypothetical protein
MFGRPKFSDSTFLVQEISHGMEVTSRMLERDHPSLSANSAQYLMVWVVSICIHAIMKWGQTNSDAIQITYVEFGRSLPAYIDGSVWSLEKLGDEIETCQQTLRDHVQSVDYDAIKSASKAYYAATKNREGALGLTEQQFVSFAVTSMLGTLERLRQRSHIKP